MKMPTQEAFQINWCLHINEKNKTESLVLAMKRGGWASREGKKETGREGENVFPQRSVLFVVNN